MNHHHRQLRDSLPLAFGAMLAGALMLAAVFLGGCSSGARAPRWGVVSRVESEARHNVQWSLGPRCTWDSGAYAQVLGGRRERVEEPSIRGESEENQFAAEVYFPIGQ